MSWPRRRCPRSRALGACALLFQLGGPSASHRPGEGQQSGRVAGSAASSAPTTPSSSTPSRPCASITSSARAFRTTSPTGPLPPATKWDWRSGWPASTCASSPLLPALRQRLVDIVEAYLKQNPRARERAAFEPFYFSASELIVIPTPFVARNLEEFADGIRKVSLTSIHYHFIDARLRLKLNSNDFSVWLEHELDLARWPTASTASISTLRPCTMCAGRSCASSRARWHEL